MTIGQVASGVAVLTAVFGGAYFVFETRSSLKQIESSLTYLQENMTSKGCTQILSSRISAIEAGNTTIGGQLTQLAREHSCPGTNAPAPPQVASSQLDPEEWIAEQLVRDQQIATAVSRLTSDLPEDIHGEPIDVWQRVGEGATLYSDEALINSAEQAETAEGP